MKRCSSIVRMVLWMSAVSAGLILLLIIVSSCFSAELRHERGTVGLHAGNVKRYGNSEAAQPRLVDFSRDRWTCLRHRKPVYVTGDPDYVTSFQFVYSRNHPEFEASLPKRNVYNYRAWADYIDGGALLFEDWKELEMPLWLPSRFPAHQLLHLAFAPSYPSRTAMRYNLRAT